MKNSVYFHIENNNFIPVGLKFDHIMNIDSYEDAVLDEVYVQDLLDFYDDKNCLSLLSLIIKKLNVGGMIFIQSVDIKQLGIAITFGEVDHTTVKNILYPNKKSIHDINEMINMLQSHGMQIETKKYTNIFEYHISAKKL